eukprot:GHRR01007682.1.p1 GENE.GHRR01007682.1~~GHRR01007682.1.p1  ORF type:complete len:432 (+),score=152.84 GHRR01007682.1:237-1532(+)
MSSDLEEQKKLLLPILQRAEEVQAVEPRVAYYCRLYAIKKALEISQPTKEIAGLIKATFAQCEKDKPNVKPNEDQDRLYCESFALTVFKRADKVDRAGRADINTCKAFYAAAIFLQVLEQFYDKSEEMLEMAPDLVEKIRYALWRAAEIRKALREGRQPAPPPDTTATGANDTEPTRPGGAAADALRDSGDMFAGPSYEQSQPDADGLPLPPPPPPGPPTAAGSAPATAHTSYPTDSVTSSTDEFLGLPSPPSTVPSAGSTGLLAPAAAAGPRYRPGSRVWCCIADASAPEEGTVGMLIDPAGGRGGQAVYKVALRDRLAELSDSQLAPAAGEGARVLFVAAHGEMPVHGSVLAAAVESWPCKYLLQLDDGRTLDTDGGHISPPAPGQPQQQQRSRPAGLSSPRNSGGGSELENNSSSSNALFTLHVVDKH